MIACIDDHREANGVEPICRVLPIAPSSYHDHVVKRVDPDKQATRARRDLMLKPEVERVFTENFEVHGARKVWRQLNRESIPVARCTVERLMADLGLQGVIRGRPIPTTVQDKAAPCPLDHVNRAFHAPAPDRLWLSDFHLRRHLVRRSASVSNRWRPMPHSTWPSSSTPTPAAPSAGG